MPIDHNGASSITFTKPTGNRHQHVTSELHIISILSYITCITFIPKKKWYTLIRKPMCFQSRIHNVLFKKVYKFQSWVGPLQILGLSFLITNVSNVNFFNSSASSFSLHCKPEQALVLKTLPQFSCQKTLSTFLVCSIISQYQFALSF
jgi:hypothetical protein